MRRFLPAIPTAMLLLALGCGGGSSGGGSGAGTATGSGTGSGTGGSTANQAPVLQLPGPQQIPEEIEWDVTLSVTDPDGDPVRVFVDGLPPGALWHENAQRLLFRPDFIQGGDTYTVSVTATDGVDTVSGSFSLEILDTISPPWPSIASVDNRSDHDRVRLTQTTDDFLDSPGYAGRSFTARVVTPNDSSATNRYPVRVYLHGFGGAPYTGGSAGQFRIYAHDPDNTYWWGYSDQLPAGSPSSGTVPNYTQRRVLHLLEWVLRHYSGADPDRVYVVGGSMGGSGAANLGLYYGRHFAYVYSTIGQMIQGNHRPARRSQLEGWWGTTTLNLDDGRGLGVWDRLDLTRMLADRREARHQFIYTKHGKDDGTIHFGAVVLPSPLTGRSFYQALQAERIGHYCVWDEGGHGSNDPVLGASWWDGGWDLTFDSISYLRRNLPFPAFTNSVLNDDPGDGGGNGNQSWSTNRGYAGSVGTAGDTGWNGDVAGALNRFLRWDSTRIVDTIERLEMPLMALNGSGGAAPGAGYPTTGDQLDGTLPVTVDVTIRRLQRFQLLPGEIVQWRFGGQSGTATAANDGSVTIPALSLVDSWQTLVLAR